MGAYRGNAHTRVWRWMFLALLTIIAGASGVRAEDVAWTWIKGADTIGEAVVYGTRGQPTMLNTPGARSRAVTWTDTSGAMWLFGGLDAGGTLDMRNDLWKYDPASNTWTWMKGADTKGAKGTYGAKGTPHVDNTPGARFDAVSWTDPSGTFWLFGGNGYDSQPVFGDLNDLWKYDPATNMWTWMKGSNETLQKGTYGTRGTPHIDNTPGARVYSFSCVDPSGRLWLFGGSGLDGGGGWGSFNDLWRYTPSTNMWTWMSGAQTVDEAGSYGMRLLPNAGNMPGGRDNGVMWADASGAVWLFGGGGYAEQTGSWDFYGRLNDVWRYTPSTNMWTWMKGVKGIDAPGVYGTRGMPHDNNTPGGRDSDLSWVDESGDVWLFGGRGIDAAGNEGALNDLWLYDQTANTWTWVKGPSVRNQGGVYGTQGVPGSLNKPGARHAASSWIDRLGGLWLFGGEGLDSVPDGGSLSDLWRAQPNVEGDLMWLVY